MQEAYLKVLEILLFFLTEYTARTINKLNALIIYDLLSYITLKEENSCYHVLGFFLE